MTPGRLALFTLAAATLGSGGPLQSPVVRAVLFYSPTCPHCHKVIRDDLPVIFGDHGGEPRVNFDQSLPAEDVIYYHISNGQVEILLVDVSKQAGAQLFLSSTERYGVPRERGGVPRMVIADTVFVGSLEIPTHLPPLIEQGLAGAGIDWPDIEGIQAALGTIPGLALAAEETEPTLAAIPERKLTMMENFRRDPLGNGFSVVILIGMVISIVAVGYQWRSSAAERDVGWAIPVVSLVGIAVAAYLTYVETSGATAVCGPVGDCNEVQQSEYASLFGVIPVGLLGLFGYAAIIAAWLISRMNAGKSSDWARCTLLALTVVGTLFSIYLTFLEPFVIGATCAWCLTSAVVITILMWLSVGPAREACSRLAAEGIDC